MAESLLNFCSNDYLGLAGDDPRVREAFKAGVDEWGVGARAHPTSCPVIRARIVRWKKRWPNSPAGHARYCFRAAMPRTSGVINALLGVRRTTCSKIDLNHASLLDGGRVSRAGFHWFGASGYGGS